MTRLTTLALLLGLVSLGSPTLAAAQGLGGALSDPTGREAPRPRPAPAAPVADEDLEIPEPAGYGEPPAARSSEPPSSEDTGVSLRLRALDATFATLAARGGPDYLRGILSLLGGAAGVAVGALLYELGETAIAPYLMVLGSITIVRSILLDFVLPPNATPAAIEYQQMPTGTRAQRLARLEYGEAQLASLADQSFILRMVDGSLNLAAALAIIPAYLVPNYDSLVANPLQAFIFVGPGIALITSIITFASRSAAEQRWDAYREMRARLAGTGEEAVLDLSPIAPTVQFDATLDPNGGGLAWVRGTF